MIGRFTQTIEVPNDQPWNTFFFNCYDGDRSMPLAVETCEAYMRPRDEDEPVVQLDTFISGNQAGVDMSLEKMQAIPADVYMIEMKIVAVGGDARQIRGPILVVDPV